MPKVPKVLQDQGQQVLKVPKVLQDQGQQVLKVLQVHKEPLVLKVLKVLMVLKERQEHLDQEHTQSLIMVLVITS